MSSAEIVREAARKKCKKVPTLYKETGDLEHFGARPKMFPRTEVSHSGWTTSTRSGQTNIVPWMP
jgi:hypothetical protein